MYKSFTGWAGQKMGGGMMFWVERVNFSTATPISWPIKGQPFSLADTASSQVVAPFPGLWISQATRCLSQCAPLGCPGGCLPRVGHQAEPGAHLLPLLAVAMGGAPLVLGTAVGEAFLLLPCLVLALALVVALEFLKIQQQSRLPHWWTLPCTKHFSAVHNVVW